MSPALGFVTFDAKERREAIPSFSSTMVIFPGARNFTVNNSQFVDQSSHTQININIKDGSEKTGFQTLLEASIPEASYDSSARYPPPLCHPGTRKDYIERLIRWSLNVDNHTDRIVWLRGPAGVGKSALAQSCAEALGEKLGAAFFFSRSNNWDDPDRLFTSISHQLAVKFNSYGDLLDSKIHRNPTLVKKSIPYQFHNLLVAPFRELKAKGEEVTERVIIIDGLDECATAEAQIDIIKLVVESARTQSTPFLWIFLSRLEPHLFTAFDSTEVGSLCLRIEIPVSREIDNEITLYLTDKLADIARKHGLTLPWPSEEDIGVIVDLSAGLFACVHTVVRFVDEEDSAGPMDQLDAVLRLAKRIATKGPNHPLSGLDDFYALIMERVPPKRLQTVQWILLATRMPGIQNAIENATLLGLSEIQFRDACRSLHSVMRINEGLFPSISFYHASFMDYLEDPARSRGFCIWADCAVALWDELLRKLNQIRVVNYEPDYQYIPELVYTWQDTMYFYSPDSDWWFKLVRALFELLVSSIDLNNDAQRLKVLMNLDFKRISFLRPTLLGGIELQVLLQKTPPKSQLIRCSKVTAFAQRIFQKSKRPPAYVIGSGDKKALLTENCYGRVTLIPYPKQQRSLKQLYDMLTMSHPVDVDSSSLLITPPTR